MAREDRNSLETPGEFLWGRVKMMVYASVFLSVVGLIFKWTMPDSLVVSTAMTPPQQEIQRTLLLHQSCWYIGFAREYRYRLDLMRSGGYDVEDVAPYFDELDAVYQKWCTKK